MTVGCYHYGLVLSETEVLNFAKQYAKLNHTPKEKLGDMGDVYDAQHLCDTYIEYETDFDGSVFPIMDNGAPNLYKGYDISRSAIFYIDLVRYPSLIFGVYETFDDIVNELKQRVGMYLPENYDYRNNIQLICGTYQG